MTASTLRTTTGSMGCPDRRRLSTPEVAEGSKDRALGFDDVKHYRQIIKILLETSRIMQTITLTLDVPT